VATSPDYSPVCSPDYLGPPATSLDSLGPIPIGMGAAADLFCAAKAAEGASPRTVEWYRMILIRAVRRFGEARPVDAIPAAELRAWLLELRSSLAPESIAGYVRGLKAFGNWCAAEEIAAAAGFRALRRPKVPRRLIAPFSDPELRSLLALADERERALTLVLLDTGLRLSELASLRVGDVRPDGTLHVMGKGAKERIVPIGASARRALVRYLATRQHGRSGPGRPTADLRRATASTQHAPARRTPSSAAGPGAGRDHRPVQPAFAAPHVRPQLWSCAISRWRTRTSRRAIGLHHPLTGSLAEGGGSQSSEDTAGNLTSPNYRSVGRRQALCAG